MLLLGVKLTLADVVVTDAKLGVPGAAQAAEGVVKVMITAGVVPPPEHTACRLRVYVVLGVRPARAMGEVVPVLVTAVPPPWGVAMAVKPVLPAPAVKVASAEVGVRLPADRFVGAVQAPGLPTVTVVVLVQPLASRTVTVYEPAATFMKV